jgi:hypothetical protein
MQSPGEKKAWEMLRRLDPAAVRGNAAVLFDQTLNQYVVRSFCWDFLIDPLKKSVRACDQSGEGVLKRHGYFFMHSCLWYLVHAKDIPLTGKLIKPANLRGGELFFRGSHVLPLESLADKYSDNRKSFMSRGKELCAASVNFGDASLQLLPLPRIPVTLILWLHDEEFPARADLLFDSSCEMQVPIDILWSLAMLSLLVMM